MAKTSHHRQTGMKDLNIQMPTLVVVIAAMVAAMRAIKANSLNHSLVKADIVKVEAVGVRVKVWTLKAKIITLKF
jgi:hypothetical protein